MSVKNLYDGITLVADDLVDRAAEPCLRHRRKRPTWVPKLVAAAACAVLILTIPRFIGMGGSTDSATPGTAAPSTDAPATSAPGAAPPREGAPGRYTGPVFPLDISDGDGLMAEREATFDLSGEKAIVTDNYLLTNTTDNDLTRTVYYPFVSDLRELSEHLPTLTVDGAEVETILYQGAYSGGFSDAGNGSTQKRYNLKAANNWTDYEVLLDDGSYQAYALSEGASLDIPVVVYRITGASTTLQAGSVGIDVAFDPETTTVLTYGINGYSYEVPGRVRYSYFAKGKGLRMLVVIGEDLTITGVAGYQNLGCEDDERTANVTLPDITREEIMLDARLLEMAEAELADHGYAQEVTPAMLYRGAGDILTQYGLLSENPAERYQNGRLDDLFEDALGQNRVFYLAAEVTVPAGGTVAVTAEFAKAANADFPGSGSDNQDVLGYDLVTTLGSRLTFTGQTARLAGWEETEIVRQNYGFDLAAGVTKVRLTEEHFYLEIRK